MVLSDVALPSGAPAFLDQIGGEEPAFSRACLRRRACACVSEEGRHCSLTSPFSPAIRCSQTGLCYSEASTGDRPPAKRGAPPGVWNGACGYNSFTTIYDNNNKTVC